MVILKAYIHELGAHIQARR